MISEDAAKILIQIYKTYVEENRIMSFSQLKEISSFDENRIKRALKYCDDKGFLYFGKTTMDGTPHIRGISSIGIDIIEDKTQKPDGRTNFQVTFNVNNEFNIDSIIKGEAKLF